MFIKYMTEDQLYDERHQKRQEIRRTRDQCVIEIDGKNHPVINWSAGGVLMAGDDRLYSLGDQIKFKLKFMIDGDILSLSHVGEVIRLSSMKLALKFAPMALPARSELQKIKDSITTREFADSQI